MRYSTMTLAALALGGGIAFAPPPPAGWNPPALSHLDFSADGKTFVAHFCQTPISGMGGNLQLTQVHDARTGKRLAKIPAGAHHYSSLLPVLRPGHPQVLFARPVPDRRYREEELVLWDYTRGKEVAVFRPTAVAFGSLAFSRDGKKVYSGHWDNRLLAWDVASARLERTFDRARSFRLSSAHIPTFFRPPGGKRLVTCYFADSQVWDTTTGKVVAPKLGANEKAPSGERYRLWACTPDGKVGCLSTGYLGRDRQVLRLRDLTTGKKLRDLGLPGKEVNWVMALAFAQGGKLLKVMDASGRLSTWDVATGKQRSRWPILTGVSTQAARFSPDGRWLVTNGKKKTLLGWDARTGKTVWEADVPGS
jgi:outer membrane protein assembly factor BamB